MSFKPTNFDSILQNDDKEKTIKPSSTLRQTISNKSSFRPKTEKCFSESFEVHHTQSTLDLNQKSDPQQFSYSRKTTYVPENRSWHTIETPNK